MSDDGMDDGMDVPEGDVVAPPVPAPVQVDFVQRMLDIVLGLSNGTAFCFLCHTPTPDKKAAKNYSQLLVAAYNALLAMVQSKLLDDLAACAFVAEISTFYDDLVKPHVKNVVTTTHAKTVVTQPDWPADRIMEHFLFHARNLPFRQGFLRDVTLIVTMSVMRGELDGKRATDILKLLKNALMV
jgi:hypothetical protein